MVDTAGGRATPVDGGLQGGNRQAGVDPSADGVADDPARPGVKDDGDVDEAGRDRDIGNVRHPELVRSGEGHVPGSMGEDRAIEIAVRGRNVAAPDLRLEAVIEQYPPDFHMVEDDAMVPARGPHAAVYLGITGRKAEHQYALQTQ